MKELSATKPKTCFIENDSEIDKYEEGYILGSIELATGREDLVFDQLFDITITEASQRQKEVWDSILKSDYIFIDTAFIGDSGRLLEEMCEMALVKKIGNKSIVNFRNSDTHLFMTERGINMLQTLKERHNVQYVAKDTPEFVEICKRLIS